MPVIIEERPVLELKDRIRMLQWMFDHVVPMPEEWFNGKHNAAEQERPEVHQYRSNELRPIACQDYRTLVAAWRKALKWTKNLDCTLSVMLGAVASTQFVGEQLWFKIEGPPASGKTTLAEGLAVCKHFVISRDTIRGFHDGWRDSGEGEDLTLTALVNGKTFITKDGDTLLKAPELPRILAEARALYDKVSRTDYRNRVRKEYLGHRMTWLLCGTKALREIDDSELGARFLDCVVMDEIDDEFEDDVGLRAAHQEARNMLQQSNGKPESQYPEELAQAMALTGGFVEYLRNNAHDLSSQVQLAPSTLHCCNRLGKFIAYMRARPSKKDEDDSDREFSARLVKQMVRLTQSLAIVLGERKATERTFWRVHKVALDTARGISLDIARKLAVSPIGMESRGLALHLLRKDDDVRKALRFLRKIHVCYTNEGNHRMWRLTPKLLKLYREVNTMTSEVFCHG